MLICPLYHRINKEKYSNSLDIMTAHLQYISQRYNVVVPGEPLHRTNTNICLTFDDAFFDFYHYVFPLLQKYGVRALLAVPVKYIQEQTTVPAATRLAVLHDDAQLDAEYQRNVPFCTWAELKEMAESGVVQMASHSFSHSAIRNDGSVDLDCELLASKRILEE